MHIAFIEDTKLHGGTQLWVMDAIRFFRTQGWEITIISPNVIGIFVARINNHWLVIAARVPRIVIKRETDILFN